MIDLSIKLHALLSHFCNQYNVSIDDILEKNILKLKARYVNKFSSDKAINRDLETERKILEGKPVEIIEEGIFPSETNVYFDGMGINQRTSTTSNYLD